MKFAARADIILGGNNTASYTVNTADVDGNGLLDVLVGRRGQPNVAYLQGPGLDFSLEMPFGTGRDNTYSVGGADLDGDGDIDLYVGNAGEPNAIYFQE